MFAARRLRRPVDRLPRPAPRRPRADRRRRSRPTAPPTRWCTTSTSTAGCAGSAIAERPLLDRLAAAHELHHRFGGAPYGMLVPIVPAARAGPGVSRRAGRGRPTSLTRRTARSGRTAPRRTSARLASAARRRRGAATGRTRAPRRRRDHRLNVPRRPIGQLADAGDGQQPGRLLQLDADTAGPAARKRRHAAARTSARVTTAIGPPSSPGSSPASTSTPRHVPWPPMPRRRTS